MHKHLYQLKHLNALASILTNAHVIANASFIQVQRQGGSKKYRAFVEFVSNETDLAKAVKLLASLQAFYHVLNISHMHTATAFFWQAKLMPQSILAIVAVQS